MTVEEAVRSLLKWRKSKSHSEKLKSLDQEDEFFYLVLSLNKIPHRDRGRTHARNLITPPRAAGAKAHAVLNLSVYILHSLFLLPSFGRLLSCFQALLIMMLVVLQCCLIEFLLLMWKHSKTVAMLKRLKGVVLRACLTSKTIKRVVYTSAALAVSYDGKEEEKDESSWIRC
ncbi:hypothetical protein K1719_010519 [Acacia pycnantha]|nr:hypothetical protein K1719_010519 [Acacia pycnantha]